MRLRPTNVWADVLRRIALAVAFSLLASPGHGQAAAEAAAAPFQSLSGTWSGTGSITLGTGDKERIRCRVIYDVAADGMSFHQELRCASDSYKFEMTSDVTYVNGFINGRWHEATRRKFGSLTGRVIPSQIQATAETTGFSAFLTMTTRGDRQMVRIESKSPEVTEVSITLRRISR